MEYDEIRITTRREIDVCRGVVQKLEKLIRGFEEKYGMTSTDFSRNAALYDTPAANDLIRWKDSLLSLCRWKERLCAHLWVLKNY
jgi:hypothetical protein